MEIKYLKLAQLATALGTSNASISMAHKNGKLIREEDKTYDIQDPTNRLWINNMVAKGKEFDLSKIFERKKKQVLRKTKAQQKLEPIKKSVPKPEEKIIINTGTEGIAKPSKQSNENYIQKKRRLELKQTQNRIILDELKIKKIKGDLIPYDAVKTVFLYAVETIKTTYQQEVDALANIFIRRLGGNHEKFIELQKALSEKITAIQLQAQEDLIQGLKGVQAEYQEVRSRGERK